MALCTASGLLDDFNPIIMAPPGPALEEASRRNFEAISFRGAWEFALALRGILARGSRFAFLATGVMHSSVCLAWNRLYRRRIAHLHLVHGGASEELSYGRKRKLNGAPVQFVAVSSYVRERLLAHRVNASQIDASRTSSPKANSQAAPPPPVRRRAATPPHRHFAPRSRKARRPSPPGLRARFRFLPLRSADLRHGLADG